MNPVRSLVALGALAVSVPALLGAAPKPATPPPATRATAVLAPVGVKTAKSSHAPFETGECEVCHTGGTKDRPGPVEGGKRALCMTCHDQLDSEMQAAPHQHDPAMDSCVDCHNPHNAAQPHLLREALPGLCLDCHGDIAESLASSVKHDATSMGQGCMNCHNPHASEVEKLLSGNPYDLCVSCHSQAGMKDGEGVALTDFKGLFAKNPNKHGPVAKGDCSACHEPHGGRNFRLLAQAYPPSFYAPYEAETYTLCFRCHDAAAFTEARTTTATSFRNGDQNLHYVHVHKAKHGRTCRACHEVHASPQDFHIRESVPYGTRGWQLQLNYEQKPNGGSCAKTCHTTLTYDNGKK